jgi:hypothetical protein
LQCKINILEKFSVRDIIGGGERRLLWGGALTAVRGRRSLEKGSKGKADIRDRGRNR